MPTAKSLGSETVDAASDDVTEVRYRIRYSESKTSFELLEGTVWKDGKEDMLLDAKSPSWIEVRILGGDSKQAKEIPLKDGRFEMRSPKALFEENRRSWWSGSTAIETKGWR